MSDSPENWSDERLDAEAAAYLYGETDFSDLPMVQPGPLTTPDDDEDDLLSWRTA
jgi:hypothetical protein